MLKNQIKALQWKLEGGHPDQRKIIESILKRPNNDDTWQTFIEQLIEDILVIGQLTAERGQSKSPERPLFLWPTDAGYVDINMNWDGRQDTIRFGQVSPDKAEPVYLKDSEMMFARINPRTNTPYGLSPMEVAALTIDHFLGAQNFAGKMARQAIPRKLIDLGEGVGDPQVKAFRLYWQQEIEGRGKTPIFGGGKNAKTHDLGATGDDGLYLEWQHFLIQIIAVAFDVDPGKLAESKGGKTAEQIADRGTTDTGVRPLAELVADTINKEIIEFLGFRDVKFEFIYHRSLQERKTLSEVHEKYLEHDVVTINEVRAELGLGSIKDGECTVTEYRLTKGDPFLAPIPLKKVAGVKPVGRLGQDFKKQNAQMVASIMAAILHELETAEEGGEE